MKRTLFLAITFFSFSFVMAQHEGHKHSEPVSNKPATAELLELKVTEHDFGKIPQNKPVYYYFEVTNKSQTPIKIESVTATCGCTTPEWNKEEILPGVTDKIKVGYNAASEGPFEKPITIVYNGGQTIQVKIKGHVWKAPTGSAPNNQSVQFLKQQIQ
ncbi:MAG: DUF1573 domain-containing protein [Flavisolibacter sp.]